MDIKKFKQVGLQYFDTDYKLRKSHKDEAISVLQLAVQQMVEKKLPTNEILKAVKKDFPQESPDDKAKILSESIGIKFSPKLFI